MKNYIPILKKTVLFSGVKESEIESMLSCLQAKKYHFKKGEFVLSQGQRLDNLLILLDGKLYIQQDDYWGNRSILNVVNPGEMFGESYAAPESGFVMNDVMAVEDSDVIFFDVKKYLRSVLLPAGSIRLWWRILSMRFPKETGRWCRSSVICQSAQPAKN